VSAVLRLDASVRPVVFACVLVLAVTLAPYAVAVYRPPPGMTFIGTFYYGSDFLNYLSYVQQAEEGAFLFRNRLLLDEHAPALVNLEWWLVGMMSRLLGGRPLLAYRLFAVFAAFGFFFVTDRWLRRLGLSDAHRLPALLLMATGGGLGGLLFTLAGRPLERCLDIYAGLFPFLGLLTNPHFTAGTTLFLLALLLFETARTARGQLDAVAVATVLALVRPYDLVVLVVVRTASVLVQERPRSWFAALLPLAGLLPVVVYLYWLFYRNPAFAFYASAPYPFPPLLDFMWALAPAVAFAVPGMLRSVPDEVRSTRTPLVAWAVFGLLFLFFRPVPFSLQFFVGIGMPLLALAALAVGNRPPRATLLLADLFSTSALAVLAFVTKPNSWWFVPREDMAVVRALRTMCRPGDIVFAPASIGVLAYGLTPCRAFVAHGIDPRYREKVEAVQKFGSLSPEERAAFLDAQRITHLVLPGDAGPRPVEWLGAGTAFGRHAVVAGGQVLSLYVRTPPSPASP
jgi:hypothetical protein